MSQNKFHIMFLILYYLKIPGCKILLPRTKITFLMIPNILVAQAVGSYKVPKCRSNIARVSSVISNVFRMKWYVAPENGNEILRRDLVTWSKIDCQKGFRSRMDLTKPKIYFMNKREYLSIKHKCDMSHAILLSKSHFSNFD